MKRLSLILLSILLPLISLIVLRGQLQGSAATNRIGEISPSTVTQTGVITGTIFANDGVTRLENIWVYALEGGNAHCSDDLGRYVIEDLPFGEYHVSAASDPNDCKGGAPSKYVNEFYFDAVNFEDATTILVTATADLVTGIDFALEPGGAITGTVYAEDGETPLENILVYALEGGHAHCTDENGRYATGGLPFGDHVMKAEGDLGFCSDGGLEYFSEYFFEARDIDHATAIPVTENSDLVTDIDFTMERLRVVFLPIILH